MSGTNCQRGTGGYGGASMAIPMILLCVCLPQIVVAALVIGVIWVVVTALAAALR